MSKQSCWKSFNVSSFIEVCSINLVFFQNWQSSINTLFQIEPKKLSNELFIRNVDNICVLKIKHVINKSKDNNNCDWSDNDNSEDVDCPSLVK